MTKSISHDSVSQLHRFRLIEVLALWEGRVITNQLCDVFDIKRQQASRDINTYNRHIAPNNLEYDPKTKGYRPSQRFRPRLTQGIIDEYLQILNSSIDPLTGQSLFGNHLIELTHMPQIKRQVKPIVLQPLIQAIRQRRAIKIRYTSLTRGKTSTREIAPHSLVNTGYRWHVRAYCYQRKAFADFVLGRIGNKPEILLPSEHQKEHDELWHLSVDVVVQADPRLPASVRRVIEMDYGMRGGQLKLTCSAALVPYLLQLYRIDGDIRDNPKEQQIVLANKAQLKRFLFDQPTQEKAS